MHDHEAIILTGAERFSNYLGCVEHHPPNGVRVDFAELVPCPSTNVIVCTGTRSACNMAATMLMLLRDRQTMTRFRAALWPLMPYR